jgi:hypothetical protein
MAIQLGNPGFHFAQLGKQGWRVTRVGNRVGEALDHSLELPAFTTYFLHPGRLPLDVCQALL